MTNQAHRDIPPYTGITFDSISKHELSDGTKRSFRIVVYKGINGYSGEPPAIAVFDDDYGLVINDALYVDETEAERHAKAVELAGLPFEEFRQTMNQALGVRHKLEEDGTLPWNTVSSVLADFKPM